MSPVEISSRIMEEVKKKSEKVFYREFSPDVSLNGKEIQWYFKVNDRDRITSFLKETICWNRNKANNLLDHKFSFFSFNNKKLGETINWLKDYKNDKTSPLKYCKDINYRNFDEVGDIKYTWEINRHQHLIQIAKAYYLTCDKKYKEEVIEQIKKWLETNPYMKGVNWESPLELGIRLISWSWVWHYIGDIDKKFKSMWLDCIYKQCFFISKNLSRHSSANNHLIGEAAGLFIASIVWPFEKESMKWQMMSYKILIKEMEVQNYDDGVNKEQAISYQQFVLDFFLLSGLLGEKNGVKFPEVFWNRLEKMLGFIASIMDCNGNVPNIGDDDEGYAVTLSEEKDFNPYQSLLATGAVLFKRGDFKNKVDRFDEKALWLIGLDAKTQFNDLDEKKFVPIKSFKKGGYYVLSANKNREDEVVSVFDCGPLGFLSIAAHGHSDALSFTLNIGGTEIIVDPGTYAYHSNKEWREYFKGTSAHNTIRIDGENQSVSGGNFMWLKKAKTRLIKYESNKYFDLVAGEHDGYKRLRDSVLHKRKITFDKKGMNLIIVDKITANKKHMVEQFFHFSRDCVVEKINGREWDIKNNDKSILLRVDSKLRADLYCGNLEPLLGWQSKRFDVKENAFTLVNSGEFIGNCKFVTMISIGL